MIITFRDSYDKKHQFDITIDVSSRQIRVVDKKTDKIEFFNMSHDDVAGYTYLLENKKYKALKESVCEDLGASEEEAKKRAKTMKVIFKSLSKVGF